ncbi:MAG: hypothetical protein NC200_04795 [Candidatus Gastranaerophilales bacterium]|nr:hypothetical protein [Candidatus Gastranaerophilales bacterium]
MKKIILTCLILLLGVVVNAEPIPVQDPTAPDTPYYMDSDNVLKEKPTASESENNNEANSINDNENITEQEEVLSGEEENPIEFDASQENINDKNFKPTEHITPQEETNNIETKQTKKDKKKSKKTKKQENKNPEQNVNNLEEEEHLDMQETPANGEEQPTAPKTYSQDDYEQMYRDMPVPTFTFVHGIDPDQYYDMKDTTWSPYPLLRLNAPLYFKTIVIPPGYYLLTPRKYKDDWYILFKEAGTVKYTIPVFAKDYTPEFYYNDTLPELDMTKSQRWQLKFLNAWGKYIRSSKRRPATKTNVELTDLDNSFLLIELYYGAHKYSTIFRTEKF